MGKINFKCNAKQLRILAMLVMLLDHLWATIVPGNAWMSWVGRLAFPLFAFLLAEGYFHTGNLKKYLKRMLLFALLSEIPFNLVYGGSFIYPFHQNVLWTFLLGLLTMAGIDRIRKWEKWYLALPVALALMGAAYGLAFLLMLDYYGCGLAMVLVFYFLRGKRWYTRVLQFAAMLLINVYLLGTMTTELVVFGHSFHIVQQGIAVLALIPIWCYSGEKGNSGKCFQYFCYAFYPLHLLILGLIWLY